MERGAYARVRFGQWAGPMLRTHRSGKGPGHCRGWGLGSRNRRGPGVPPTPGLRGWGSSPGSPAGFLDSSGRGKCPPLLLSCSSCSSCPRGPLLPASLVLLLAFLLCTRTNAARGPWRAVDQPGSSAVSLGQVGGANTLHSSPVLPDGSSYLPLLISRVSLLCSQGPMWPRGGFGGQGTTLGAQQAPWPSGPGDCPLLLSHSSQRAPATYLS